VAQAPDWGADGRGLSLSFEGPGTFGQTMNTEAAPHADHIARTPLLRER
jgi:hypothetical protein